jgi:UDP-N-acetylglucosamine 2-epimerase (non-hydrolysing)
MFRQVAETFGFAVDADLNVMRPNQTLAGQTVNRRGITTPFSG